jgi:hypothetical protein
LDGAQKTFRIAQEMKHGISILMGELSRPLFKISDSTFNHKDCHKKRFISFAGFWTLQLQVADDKKPSTI